jgi:hypothetical protein
MNRNKIINFKDYASIDDIPLDIVKLSFTNLKLKVLPDLSRFTQLRSLHCSLNRLTNIDNLPHHIEYIHCFNNRITEINNLPYSLLGLFCANNRIKYIAELPFRLRRLFCNKNLLTSIPDLPYLMEIIMCRENPLYCVPYLPYSLNRLYCNTIPDIYPDNTFYTINTVNNFRFNYYTLKYGHKILFYLIKKRMDKINKYLLLETSAKIVLHPTRINQLLNKGISIEEIADNI